nr:FeoA family protein [Caulobacter sp. S45]
MARGVVPLGRGARGLRGVVASVGTGALAHAAGGLEPAELERRLLEIGFVEGARIEILHEGALGGDPIAVRIDDARVALRRREADAVLIQVEAGRLRPRRGLAA